MKKRNQFFRRAILLLCVIAMALVILASFKINYEVGVTDSDETLWSIMHTYKGSYKDKNVTMFSFLENNNSELIVDVAGYFVDQTIYCIFPEGTDVSSLCLTYQATEPLYINGKRIYSGWNTVDLTKPILVEFGEDVYEVVVRFTSLPILEIDTADEAYPLAGEKEKGAVVNLFDVSGNLLVNDTASIRVRGNYTSTFSKLAWRLETTDEQSLLGMPTDDTWSLLANFLDPSLLRNEIAFELGRALQLEYTPQQRFVEVYMNGKYQGVYTITTQVGMRMGNVDLPVISEENPQGSYLLEFDARSEELENVIHTPLGLTAVIDSPNIHSEQLRTQIEQELIRLEQTITAPNGTLDGVRYTELIDIESLASWYLVNELTFNGDATIPLSTYLYKHTDGKFYMGPVWDFDLSQGFSPLLETVSEEQMIFENAWWWPYLMKDDEFKQVVQKKLLILEEWYQNSNQYFTQQEQQLQHAAQNNFIVTYIGVNEYSNTLEDDVFHEEINFLKSWLPERYSVVRQFWFEQN